MGAVGCGVIFCAEAGETNLRRGEAGGGEINWRVLASIKAVLYLRAADKIQWSLETRAPKPPSLEEENAYRRLFASVQNNNAHVYAQVTGPLIKDTDGFSLEVRQISFPDVKKISAEVTGKDTMVSV